MLSRKKLGFTLIELLIVIAIIAILAAIAIPNFLAAQVRSKVSRVKAELRMVAGALEAYYVDNTAYPLTTGYPPRPNYASEPVGIIPPELSSPVAYISGDAWLQDPFKRAGMAYDVLVYTYHNIPHYIAMFPGSGYWPVARSVYGDWRMCSIGPDGLYYRSSPYYVAPTILYDPSNGIVSDGNIWIGQKSLEPPTGPIYGNL